MFSTSHWGREGAELTYEKMVEAVRILRENDVPLKAIIKLTCGDCGMQGDTGNILAGYTDLVTGKTITARS